MLLEGYLRCHGYRDFDFEPEIVGSSRRPDYRLRWSGHEVLLEVKEFHAEPGEIRAGGGYFDPYPPLREKIDQGREKFRKLKGHCCALVLYNVNKPLVFLDWQHLYAAMLGKIAWRVPIQMPGRPAPLDDDITTVFTSGGKMHRERHGVPYAPQNQTISAVIVLSRVPAGERLFHQSLDELKAQLGNAFDLYTHLPLELEACRWTTRDPRRRPLRVVVHENPYARIPFPRELFCGPWDERYGSLEGRVQQLHLGDEAARLPPKH
jgi:hypothetical protein